MTENWKKFAAGNFFILDKKAFSPQKRTSNTSKHEISNFFLLLYVIFALLDPDPDSEYGSATLFILTKSNSTHTHF
jgi:hypothetical protein